MHACCVPRQDPTQPHTLPRGLLQSCSPEGWAGLTPPPPHPRRYPSTQGLGGGQTLPPVTWRKIQETQKCPQEPLVGVSRSCPQRVSAVLGSRERLCWCCCTEQCGHGSLFSAYVSRSFSVYGQRCRPAIGDKNTELPFKIHSLQCER